MYIWIYNVLLYKVKMASVMKATEFDIVLLYTEVYVLKSEYPQT
jgi:hypothetical protein